MTELVIIRGLPGTGKTALAKKFIERGFIHFEANEFLVENGVYMRSPARVAAAHALCQKAADLALQEGHRVVVSNTFVELWEMVPYVASAKAAHAEVTIIQTAGRSFSHYGASEQTMRKMRARWQQAPKDPMSILHALRPGQKRSKVSAD
jgi:predicted kinase